MIQQAFISGQIGRAIYTEDDRYFLLSAVPQEEPTECRPMDLCLFFNFGAEFTTVSAPQLDLAGIKEQLIAQRQAYRALALVISGLDAQLDAESRKAAIESAASLLRDAPTHRFVRARMLARPLPEEADIEVAKDIAIRSAADSVGMLYQNVLDYEQAICFVNEVWQEAATEYFASPEERVESETALLDLGVFAELAVALARGGGAALSSIIINYSQHPEIKSKLRQGVLMLNDLRTRLADKWSAPLTQGGDRHERPRSSGSVVEMEHAPESDDPVYEILAQFRRNREHSRARTFSADEAKEKVDHQIEAIGELIRRGSLNRADRFLRDLINFHVEHSEREHLGMSLCALAKAAIDAGEFELAEKMVNYALRLDVDYAVIPTTQAQIFKMTGRFNEALAVYEEAMSCFPNNEVARNGYAEVLKATGRFNEALAVYEETMSRFPNNEVTHSGYAEVLKVMGRFGKALAVYEEAMSRFPNDEVVRNGYAEVLKAMGRFDEALAVYEETMSRFPNDEVVRSGYAEVLKVMGRFGEALAVYEEAMSRFPNNEVARNGYAEVLKATGRFDEALTVYEETMLRFPNNRVVRNGYASVLMLMNRFSDVRSLLSATSPSSKTDWIDFHLLAMSYLKNDEIDEAIERLSYGFENNPWLVDRGYFATALAVAKIRKKQFAEVLDVLPTNVIGLDIFQRQTRLALVEHAQAALGWKEEAAQTLAELEPAVNPRIISLKEAIARRYSLRQQSGADVVLSEIEVSALEAKIEDEEFFLAMAA